MPGPENKFKGPPSAIMKIYGDFFKKKNSRVSLHFVKKTDSNSGVY